MRRDAFFEPEVTDDEGSRLLRQTWLIGLMKGPDPTIPDLELAHSIVMFLREELIACVTDGRTSVKNNDIRLLLKTGTQVCRRLNINFPRFPFSDFSGLQGYWKSQGWVGGGSWAVRRGYIEDQFRTVEDQLYDLQLKTWEDDLLDPITPHEQTGWPRVDFEIAELRRRFEVARNDHDHCAVGLVAVRVLEALSDAVFDSHRHVPDGEVPPSRDKTINRFNLVIDTEMPGSKNAALRKCARAVVELAQEVKHSQTPSRRDAGIASDAAIMLANMMRRLSFTEP